MNRRKRPGGLTPEQLMVFVAICVAALILLALHMNREIVAMSVGEQIYHAVFVEGGWE